MRANFVQSLWFKTIQDLCFKSSFAAGWWTGLNPNDGYVIGTKIALIHSELSEALEAARKHSKDNHLPHREGIEVELADAVIRILDLSGALGLDMEGAILEKLDYNRDRPDHKLDARSSEHGKSF